MLGIPAQAAESRYLHRIIRHLRYMFNKRRLALESKDPTQLLMLALEFKDPTQY